MEKEKNSSVSHKETVSVSAEIGGRKLTLQTGELACQANGSVLVSYGESVVLATAVMSKSPLAGTDFFPLTVDYEENYYAAGKVRGSRFMKRKGKPSDDAILNGRVVDRSIRPFFPDGMRNEVQVIITTLSFDKENDPEFLAITGASAALAVSDIPFESVLGGVKVGMINGDLVINPKLNESEKNQLDLTVVGTEEGKIAMIEAGAKEIPEAKIKEAIIFAQEENKKIIALIKELKEKAGKEKKEVELFAVPEDIYAAVDLQLREEIKRIIAAYKNKKEFDKEIFLLKEKNIPAIREKYNSSKKENEQAEESPFGEAVEKIVKEEVRNLFNLSGKRIDGRKIEEVRPLEIKVGVLPRTHGSAIFARGWTQGLTITTLGAPGSALVLDGMEDEADTKKHYMHYYSFPPFSVGECRPMRGPGRREIGHGALGEKALEPVVPAKEEFPYTIIMHTEIMSSDGSTSMASVSGSTLALMDAGVPIKKPVSGIAMGLMYHKEKDSYTVLTDLCAIEDFSGFMDFKVAGTRDGITAIQMDIKLKGLPVKIIEEALDKALLGRIQILEAMEKVIARPREKLSPYAPRVATIKIPIDKIRDVIGPGGKVINGIIEETGATIDIEQDGTVSVSSENEENLSKAVAIIKNLTREVKAGEEFIGKVVKIMDFGAFVSLTPNKDGMIHISQITNKEKVNNIRDYLKEGDEVRVKVKEIDKMGRVNLTMIF